MYKLPCASRTTHRGFLNTSKLHRLLKLHLLLKTDCSVQPPSLSLVESTISSCRVWCLLHLLKALGTISITVQRHLEHDFGSRLPHAEACMLLDGLPEVCGGGVVMCVRGGCSNNRSISNRCLGCLQQIQSAEYKAVDRVMQELCKCWQL